MELGFAAMSVVAANNPPAVKKQFFDAANRELQLQSEASPFDAQFLVYRAILLDAYGDHTAAETVWSHAHLLAPNVQSILFAMAENARARGDYQQELTYARKAYDLNQSYAKAKLLYMTAQQETSMKSGQ